MFTLKTGDYAIAHNLIGFYASADCPVTDLRVRVVEITTDPRGTANVVTASLISAGCPLTLRLANLSPIDDESDALVHKTGLVALGR